MMFATRVNEKCSCGATLTADGPSAALVAEGWRRNHSCPNRVSESTWKSPMPSEREKAKRTADAHDRWMEVAERLKETHGRWLVVSDGNPSTNLVDTINKGKIFAFASAGDFEARAEPSGPLGIPGTYTILARYVGLSDDY